MRRDKCILCVFFGGEPFYNLETEGKLRERGYQVTGLNYQCLKTAAQAYDMVIQFGLSEKEDDGIEFLRTLRHMFGDARILAVSAHKGAAVIDKVKAAGAEFFERDEWNDDPQSLLAAVDEFMCVA